MEEGSPAALARRSANFSYDASAVELDISVSALLPCPLVAPTHLTLQCQRWQSFPSIVLSMKSLVRVNMRGNLLTAFRPVDAHNLPKTLTHLDLARLVRLARRFSLPYLHPLDPQQPVNLCGHFADPTDRANPPGPE